MLTTHNLGARRVTVIGKGNKVGVVPFCFKTTKAIWFYLVERETRAKCVALRVTEEGRDFSIDGMGNWFNRLKQRARITTPSCLHKFRYTAALQHATKIATFRLLSHLFRQQLDMNITVY